MNKLEIMNNITRSFNKVGFKLKKHSPEILLVAGVAGTVTSAVMACKATTKAADILDEVRHRAEPRQRNRRQHHAVLEVVENLVLHEHLLDLRAVTVDLVRYCCLDKCTEVRVSYPLSLLRRLRFNHAVIVEREIANADV